MLKRTLALAATLTTTACATLPAPPVSPNQLPERFVGAQVAPFDLVCKNKAAPHEELVFEVVRATDGSAIVRTMNGQELRDYVTHTYMNAYLWTNGTDRYAVDRGTGVLTVTPGSRTYECEKRGELQRF